MSFKFIDLFAGIGGFRIAFERAGGTCVFSSEMDTHAQDTYEKNFQDRPEGDITKIPSKDIPEHDVLVAGFPCQAFSYAGKKRGFEDTRGTLFYEIARIANHHKPKALVLENVMGLISHDKGRTLRTMLSTLNEVGYQCNISEHSLMMCTDSQIKDLAKKMILNTKDFGIPQRRTRVYLVFWRKDLDLRWFEYPQPNTEVTCQVGDVLDTNPDPSLTISDKAWNAHKARKQRNLENGKGFGYSLFHEDSPYTNAILARYYKDGSEVLISQGEGRDPRRLSTREAARLQGFPESFEVNPSKMQAYKQFGNAVSVNVAHAIAKAVSEQIIQ